MLGRRSNAWVVGATCLFVAFTAFLCLRTEPSSPVGCARSLLLRHDSAQSIHPEERDELGSIPTSPRRQEHWVSKSQPTDVQRQIYVTRYGPCHSAKAPLPA